MTYTKMKKMILLSFRRSQCVGENQQDEVGNNEGGTCSVNKGS